jgi:hypothetical protein
MSLKKQENLISEPIFNETARLDRREQIIDTILDFKKSREKRLRKYLFEKVLNYLLSHRDLTGGTETPFYETSQEVANWYGVTRRTVERWKKKADFPCTGDIFDSWAIDDWLRKHDKLTDDFRIIHSKKFIREKETK